MNYQLITAAYDPIPNQLNGWLVCPQCGRRQRLPHQPEVLREYQAEGLVQIEEQVIDVAYVVARSDSDYLRAMAFYIPAVVGSLCAQQLGAISPWATMGVVSVGAAVLYLVAARHRLVWGAPHTEEHAAAQLPDVEEVETRPYKNSQSVFRFHTRQVCYKSGEPVSDLALWQIAQAWRNGIPFSRQMWVGKAKCSTRPAWEALRDAFIKSGAAYTNGQDVELNASARHVLAQWAEADRPTMIL